MPHSHQCSMSRKHKIHPNALEESMPVSFVPSLSPQRVNGGRCKPDAVFFGTNH